MQNNDKVLHTNLDVLMKAMHVLRLLNWMKSDGPVHFLLFQVPREGGLSTLVVVQYYLHLFGQSKQFMNSILFAMGWGEWARGAFRDWAVPVNTMTVHL